MSVHFSPGEIISRNQTAIIAANQCVSALITLGESGLFADEENDRLIQLSRATNEITQLEQVNAHLAASIVTVQPMDEGVAAELNELGNRLDEKIATNLIIDASLDFAISVLNEVSNLKSITSAHTS
jgi:hypothetical protein